MKRLFAVIVLVFLTSGIAFALSDAEYLRMKKNSSDFAKADRRLTQVWNRLKDSMSKRAFSELQDLQRDWIAYGRDEEAQALMDDGYSRVEAYTMATSDRADELPELARSIGRKYRSR